MPQVFFAVTVTLGAYLLFSLQLIICKYILPWFGSTVGVWATSLLFFQTILVAGYGYVHGSAGRLTSPVQAKFHTMLLLFSLAGLAAAAFVWPSPITPGPSWKPVGGEVAVGLILRLLLVSVGLPALLLATTGPLVQRWFTYVYHGQSPYRLYALSNAGSLLGLLSYPVVLEPLLRLHMQAWLWSMGYLIYGAAAIVCASMVARNAADGPAKNGERTEKEESAAPTKMQKTLWVFLGSVGSLMLLATTHVITEELAPIPLLWVLPLAVYLLSFIVCFDHPRWYRPGLFHFFLLSAIVVTIMIYRGVAFKVRTFIELYLMILFACCIFCHGELYRRRPQPTYLTSFYLMIALGGVFGSAFVNLLAPWLFKGYWEMPLGITLCLTSMVVIAIQDKASWVYRKNPFIPMALIVGTFLTARFWLNFKSGTPTIFLSDWRFSAPLGLLCICLLLAFCPLENAERRFASYAPLLTRCCLPTTALLAVCVLTWAETAQYRNSIWAHRNFYGVLSVQYRNTGDERFNFYQLMHGDTCHGIQMIAPDLRGYPTSYYSKNSGLGLSLLNYPREPDGSGAPAGLRVGIVGLGAGTIAAYGRHGDLFRFYEINPEVVRVASGEHGYFSFLSGSQAYVEIVEGDGRISLERELASGRPQAYDILVIDAFNGDSIPVHLLTKEAFALYLKHLRGENSIIAVHVSNRIADLSPVVTKEAESFHLQAVDVSASALKSAIVPEGIIRASEWVLLSRSNRVLSLPAIAQASSPLRVDKGLRLWTDDYSNLVQVLRQKSP